MRGGDRRICRSVSGFSLLELLFVLALVAGLVAATLGAYHSINQADSLDTAVQEVSDLLTEARGDAMTQNISVEVRLYDVPGTGDANPAYRVMQLHGLKNGASPLFLPDSVVLDTTEAHSSLIAANTEAPTPDASDSRLNAQTRVFHFLADGSTDLNSTAEWFLTLRPATSSDPAHFPTDWACLSLDPTTGRVQIFRP